MVGPILYTPGAISTLEALRPEVDEGEDSTDRGLHQQGRDRVANVANASWR
jgi:hypothetical protein